MLYLICNLDLIRSRNLKNLKDIKPELNLHVNFSPLTLIHQYIRTYMRTQCI